MLTELDAAGIEKAVVLSVAYSFADEHKSLPDPDLLSREENDWTSAQVTSGGGRLVGFCSANPLRPAALAELDRCLNLPGMRGIKLHFGNSGVTLRDTAHATRLAQLFALAEQRRAPVLGRLLYGSDLSPPGGSIRSGWELFRDRTPLTDAETRAIAGNRAYFLR